jgi:GTP-binding protein
MNARPKVIGSALPLVAIVGRPNVGKSTLVNRLLGRREAIVEQRPGVTRDRKYVECEWLGHRFRVVDTGGWLADTAEGAQPLARQISEQAEKAMQEADVIVMVVDVTVGITEEDGRVAGLLRRTDKPVLVVANKADHPNRDTDGWEFSGLGLGDPIVMSAMHGRLTDVLLDALLPHLPEPAEGWEPGEDALDPEAITAPLEEDDSDDDLSEDDDLDDDERLVLDDDEDGLGGLPARRDDADLDDPARAFAVAIVGRPNVGKSTLFNRLVGDERSIVHDAAGTTRDSIDTIVETEAGILRFVDTAGIRRKARIDESVEWYSMVRALRSVDQADAVLLVIDATQGVTHQDQRLAERVDGAGCAVVILLNKWDLVDPDDREYVMADLGHKLAFIAYAPVLRISALSGKGVHKILPAVRQAKAEYRRRVPTARLNEILAAAQQRQPPPLERGHRPRVLYATQGATDPPTFTLFVTRDLPQTYLRYLERMIREAFAFGPTPIKLRVRRRGS